MFLIIIHLGLKPKFTSLPAPTDGNLKVINGSNYWYIIRSTIGVTSNKWYAEVTQSDQNLMAGVISSEKPLNFTGYTDTHGIYGFFNNGGTGYLMANGTATSSFAISNGDVIGLAYDYDAQTIVVYQNNTSRGTVSSVPKTTIMNFCAAFAQTTASTIWNFGQRPFSYTPPTGFVALNTQNLSTPTISNGATVMAATLYTGNGSTQSITNTVNNISFKPDFVWAKSRSAATGHQQFDSVRGVTKYLQSNNSNAEGTDVNTLTAFNSNGFSIGTDTGLNANAATFVAWQWQAGQGSTSSNTNGSITSTVSVNATAGFSVVTWTHNNSTATIGHGLGVAPQMIIAKTRNGANDWFVYTQARGATKTLYLNQVYDYQFGGNDQYILQVQYADLGPPALPFLNANFIPVRFTINVNGTFILGGSNTGCEISDGALDCGENDPYTDCSTFGLDLGGYFNCIMNNFGLWLRNTLINLFVPSWSFFNSWVDDFGTFLNQKLGFIYSSFGFITGLFSGIIAGGTTGTCTIAPPGTFFGATFSVDICTFQTVVGNTVWGIIQGLVISLTILAMAFAAYRKYLEVVDHR